MSLSKDLETRKQRTDEIQRLVLTDEKKAKAALSALLKEAKKENDHGLIGFVNYQYASLCYDTEAFDKMHRYLYRALRALFVSGDREWIARTYNLFAVYAQRAGCFDVAYNYCLLALSFVEEDQTSVARAMIEANTGDLMADMGDYAKACHYVRRSIPAFLWSDTDGIYTSYVALETLNLGLFQLYDGKLDEAKETLSGVEVPFGEEKGDAGEVETLWHLLVTAQIAIADNDHEKVMEYTGSITKRVIKSPYFGLLMKDLLRVVQALVKAGKTQAAGILVKAMEDADTSDASPYDEYLLTRTRISYYKAIRDRVRLADAYEKRHALAGKIRGIQNDIYIKSVNLMVLYDELHEERKRILQETGILEQEAKIDALTGLPNRFALNERMGEVFENAKKTGRMIGVGIVDIDNFKQYNDRFGHRQGDACLTFVADTLKVVAEDFGVFVSRYGGDEFTLIYEDIGKEDIARIEEEILNRVPVSVSHGYYFAVPDENTRQWDYFTRADAAMYQKKRAGK